MRTFLWLSSVALVAAGLAVVAVYQYVERHPDSSLNRGLARMALAWTNDGVEPDGGAELGDPRRSPDAEEPSTPVLIGFEPEHDDSLLRELKIISALSNEPELIPVPPTAIPESKFATEADEFTPPKAGPNRVASDQEKFDEMVRQKYDRQVPTAGLEITEDFIENLKKAQAPAPQRFERIGIDFDGQLGPKPAIIVSDLDIPLHTRRGDSSACGVCAILSGICDCMSEFVAGLFGCNYEVDIAVCPDLPVPPPAPLPPDVHDALMLMTFPRGLPAECCVPPDRDTAKLLRFQVEAGTESWWLPVNEPMPDGRFKISYHRVTPGMPGAMPASVVIPAMCRSPYWNPPCAPPPGHVGSPVYPCPTAPVGPIAGWVRCPQPVVLPAPPAQDAVPQPMPHPVMLPIMRTQYVATPICQPYPPPHVVAVPPCAVVVPPAKAGGEMAPCPRTSKGFAKEVTVDFKEQPLPEVLEQFRELAGLNIVCDKPALDAAEVPMNHPVTLKLDKVPCRVALKHALRYCGLVCKIEDDVVVITTEEQAVGFCPPLPCPLACPIPPVPLLPPVQCRVATAAVTQACPAAKGCVPAYSKSSCAKDCCEKACGESKAVYAPRVKVAAPDGTILEIQIIMTKGEPCVEPPVKQAGFNVPDGFDTAGIPVPAIVHPRDLPKAEFPDDLPRAEAWPNLIGFRWDDNLRARELLVVSEDLRQIYDEWARIWFIDQPGKYQPTLVRAGTESAHERSVVVGTNVSNDTLHIGLNELTANPMHAVLLSANLYAVPALELAAAFWPH